MEQLNVYLERVIEVNRPDEAGEKIRGELHLAVNNALQRLQNNLVVQTRVVPFGSFVSGFYNNNSDLDLALKGFVHVAFLKKSSLKQIAPNLAPGQEWVGLSFLDQGTRAQLLRQAANLLVSHGITKRDKLQYILHARVPLIKFRDAQYGIDCDLSIGGDGTEYKAQFFKHVGEVNDGFAPLYCIIKLWMKAHLMNDGSTGTFNSHCLALLTVFYLQTCKPPLLPPLYKLLFHDRPDPGQLRLLAEGAQYNRDQAMDISKRRSSAARHQFNSQFNTLALDLAGFVNFMGDVLKEALSGANSTVRLSTWYAEQQLVPPPAGLKAYYLTVEEPFDASDNCARTFGSKRDVSWSLIYAADVFERTGQVLASAAAETVPTKAVLAYLLGPDALIGSPTCNALVPQVWTEAEQAAVLGLIQSGDSAFNAAGGKRLPGGGRSSPAAARGTAMRNMFLEALADSASEDLVDFLLPAHGVEGPQKLKDWFLDAASQQRKYVVRRPTGDNPEEEKRQKAFQGILNQITPDNLERLTNKIIEEVKVTEKQTLVGLIDKIFDKALTDTHFSELCAKMCKTISVHPQTPKFPNPEGGKDIDVRRLLLNKCQEEFESGTQGCAAAHAAADKELAARQRMLGNIQFIGFLYKNQLLTERILHGCITQLLKEDQNPRPEDVECLCKLMSTAGGQLDSTTQSDLRQAMRVYFTRMEKLRYNTKLDSRIRFMIQDVLDLRATSWIPHTKKERPKRIELVQRFVDEWFASYSVDAAAERFQEAKAGRVNLPSFLQSILLQALKQRGKNMKDHIQPLMPVVQQSLKAGSLTPTDLTACMNSLGKTMHSLQDDLPKGPPILGEFFGAFVAEGVVNLNALLQPALDEPPESPEDSEDPPLVERGGVLPMVTAILSKVKELKGEEGAEAAWKAAAIKGGVKSLLDSMTPPDMGQEDCKKAGLDFLAKEL